MIDREIRTPDKYRRNLFTNGAMSWTHVTGVYLRVQHPSPTPIFSLMTLIKTSVYIFWVSEDV